MTIRQMIIRKAKPPSRCEICHLSDQFDPETEKCNRCADLALPLAITNSVAPVAHSRFIEAPVPLRWLGTTFFLMLAAFMLCAIIEVPPISVIFFSLAVIFGFATLLLFALYFCYWSARVILWAADSIANKLQAGYHYFRNR